MSSLLGHETWLFRSQMTGRSHVISIAPLCAVRERASVHPSGRHTYKQWAGDPRQSGSPVVEYWGRVCGILPEGW